MTAQMQETARRDLMAARQWLDDVERYLDQPHTGMDAYRFDGLVRRDEIQVGDIYLSSHYGICEAVTVTTSGCHGETTQFTARRPDGRFAGGPRLERYDSRTLVPRLRLVGEGRGVHR